MAKPTETVEFINLKKHLFAFLKKEGVFVRYMINLNKECTKNNYPCQLESFIKSTLSMEVSAISGVFPWSETKEGETYWRNIHEKWYKYVKSLKNQ